MVLWTIFFYSVWSLKTPTPTPFISSFTVGSAHLYIYPFNPEFSRILSPRLSKYSGKNSEKMFKFITKWITKWNLTHPMLIDHCLWSLSRLTVRARTLSYDPPSYCFLCWLDGGACFPAFVDRDGIFNLTTLTGEWATYSVLNKFPTYRFTWSMQPPHVSASKLKLQGDKCGALHTCTTYNGNTSNCSAFPAVIWSSMHRFRSKKRSGK